MKKIFLIFSLFSFLFSLGIALSYTMNDENNANILASEGIIVDQSSNPVNYRFGDKILRQEIVAIALKMKGVELPEGYTCKKYYSDVPTNDWVCRTVELAADNGIISRSNATFRPKDFVTRAEALAMLSGVVCLPRLTEREYGFLESAHPKLAEQNSNKNEWQKVLWESISSGSENDYGLSSMNPGDWTDAQKQASNNPNDTIIRSEIFASAEFFFSYQKKYGGCETTVREPILYSEDEVIGVPNKTTEDSTNIGTYTVQYPDALVSGEVRYAGIKNY